MPRELRAAALAALTLVLVLAAPARAQERSSTGTAATDTAPVASRTIRLAAPNEYALLPYKGGESWPLRNFNGLDFLEPLVPVTAASRGDWGRIVLTTALPTAMLVSAFAFESSDQQISRELVRWSWLGADEAQDNYPILIGMIGLATLSVLLPAPEDAYGYSWELRLDRVTVLGLGMMLAALERELLVPVFDKPRPDGSHYTSANDARPSGHAASAFSSMTFLSNVLRDTLRPQDQPWGPQRIAEELLTALPYVPAFYVLGARVHSRKHDLTDTLLGGALGAFTMNLLYSWSFNRREQGHAWADSWEFTWYVDPDRKAMFAAVMGTF